MTFPLLRLPLLASTKVIKYIDLKYIISFIHLSKRANILVKRSKVFIELTVFESGIQFRKLAGKEMAQKLEIFDLSESPPKNLVVKPPSNLKFDIRVQWQIGAYKKVMNDFVEFFKVCSVAFELGSACSYTALCYMEHAKALRLKFSSARVVVGGSEGRVYQSLLKVCSSFSQLELLYETDEEFTFNGFKDYRMNIFRFSTNNRFVKWFTTDYMCALVNCLDVSILDDHWRVSDINRFLKFWMTSDGRLQSMSSSSRYRHFSIDPQVVLNGIDNRELGNRTFEIQRADGVKAKVECYHSGVTLKVIDA